MAQTLAQITKQIEKLQKEADALRRTELKGVIDRIRVAISHYGLTPDQLGFGKPAAKSAKPVIKSGDEFAMPKFTNDEGQVWSGRGPRPLWLREALADGRSLDEFRTDALKRASPIATKPGKTGAVALVKKSAAGKGEKRVKASTKNARPAAAAVPAAPADAVVAEAIAPKTSASQGNGQVKTRAAKTPGAKKAASKQAVPTVAKVAPRAKGKRLNTVSADVAPAALPLSA
ncbi:H-NS histone family protein [Variovorax sp. H27-G14]|uniref:H-NS histone family protein n=1 Tax=Variovorax sp. H27-G14 TaxID=3111914 RepID=UPI0038FCBE44